MDEWFEKEKLHFAVQDGDIEEARRLIGAGYDVDCFDKIGYTPLHYAIKGGNLKMAKMLIESGANINAHDVDHSGNTPLAEVAQECSFEVAEFLLKFGADPTLKGWMGISAVDRAKKRKKPEGIRVYRLMVDRVNNPSSFRLKCP